MSDERIVALGQRIRELRKEQGISQEALAALAGIDRSYMGCVERGEKNVTVRSLFKIADALNLKPGELF